MCFTGELPLVSAHNIIMFSLDSLRICLQYDIMMSASQDSRKICVFGERVDRMQPLLRVPGGAIQRRLRRAIGLSKGDSQGCFHARVVEGNHPDGLQHVHAEDHVQVASLFRARNYWRVKSQMGSMTSQVCHLLGRPHYSCSCLAVQPIGR